MKNCILSPHHAFLFKTGSVRKSPRGSRQSSSTENEIPEVRRVFFCKCAFFFKLKSFSKLVQIIFANELLVFNGLLSSTPITSSKRPRLFVCNRCHLGRYFQNMATTKYLFFISDPI